MAFAKTHPVQPTTCPPSSAPECAVVVMVVHGTFARGGWQQIKRNWRAAFARLSGKQPAEAALWKAPAQCHDKRWWFEADSVFEREIINLSGCPKGSIQFDRILWSGRNRFSDRQDAADTLRQALHDSIQAHPDVPHVVLAHSHGGTVAVKALDQRHPGGAPRVQALLTLGSPFVRLVPRTAPPSDSVPPRDANFSEVVAFALPATVLALAPLTALTYGFLGSDGVRLGVAGVLGLLGIVAALTSSIITAFLIVLALWLAEPKLADYMPGLGLLGFFSAVFVFKDRILSAGLRYLEIGPLWLACPLLALRAPRDEASLVIGLGQVAQGMAQAGAWLGSLIWQPLSRWMNAADTPALQQSLHPPWKRKLRGALVWATAAAVTVAVGAGSIGLGVWRPYAFHGLGSTVEGWLMLGAGSVYYGAILLLLLPLCFLLAWAVPTAAISLAAGREAFMLPAITQVEAEPLPHAVGGDGKQPATMALDIMYEARLSGLNHSLYDAAEVRQRIAQWLREQAERGRDKRT